MVQIYKFHKFLVIYFTIQIFHPAIVCSEGQPYSKFYVATIHHSIPLPNFFHTVCI